MKYHFWLIISTRNLKNGTDADPWKNINKQFSWLIDNLGSPVFALNTFPNPKGLWKCTIHYVEPGKIHYRISFINLEDACLFKMTWL